MTPEDLKETKLKRGDFLHHPALGIVAYAGKVRNHPELINVIHTHFLGGKEVRVKVKLSEVTRHKRAKARQGTLMILAVCPDCLLKIRASRKWLESGTPRCFNRECPSMGRALEIEWGDAGDGKLNADMREVGKELQREHYGRDVSTDYSDAIFLTEDDLP